MKRILFLLLLLPGLCQGQTRIPFAFGRDSDTAYSKNLLILYGVRFPAYANSDPTKYCQFDADGRLVQTVPAGGGGGGGANNYPTTFSYNSGTETFTLGRNGLSSLTLSIANLYPKMASTYANPSWISSLAWSKITSPPTTLSGYGITDATSNARSAISLTTTGTSGAATYNSTTGVLNIPNYATGGGGSGTVNSGTQYRLGYYATAGTTISEAAAITANRALISDANGVPTHSTTTTTELGYVSGVTSAIQTQLNGKEPTITAGTTSQYWRGDKSFQTLDKTAVGLPNVPNVDATNATNISSGALATARAGVPPAGASGYLLAKNSSSDYDVYWAAPTGGGGTGFTTVPITTAFTTSTAGSYVPVTGLSFPVTSGKTYTLKIYLVLSTVDAVHSVDIYAYHNSSISTVYGFTEYQRSGPTFGSIGTGANVTTYNITSPAIVSTDKLVFTLNQTFKVNASGTYQLHVFNNGSSTSITVDLGSYLQYLEF